MIWLYILIFITSTLVLFWSGSRLVKALMRVARYLGWREFVVAFIVMAIAGSLPNLFVGIDSALHGIPQLSFGDIVGGNIIDLTLAIALVILIGGVNLPARGKIVQTSTIFTAVIAVLPLVLISDGKLGRGDGLVLLFAFVFYLFWLFSKEERFKKVYKVDNNNSNKDLKQKPIGFKRFFKNLIKTGIALVLLLLASEGIVRSAGVFAETLGIGLPIVGILIIGIGNAIPEIYFAIASAIKKKNEMILGDLMGAVIVCATLVLGIVVLICPIEIEMGEFSPFALARIFLIVSALFFFVAVKTDKRVTKIEAFLLLIIYLLFVFIEIYLSQNILIP